MSSPPAEATATELAALVRGRAVSAVEAVQAALERIERLDPGLGAFVTVAADAALAEAAVADRATAHGAEPGALHGVPIAVKDLEWTQGIRTTYGSQAFADFVPSEDAIHVARLRAAGAIVVGKSNTPELGLLGETRNLLGPETRNPWDPGRTVGGSSGGSAAAVAAALVPLATGNDTAGSITCPSAMCGVFGLKPTHGRVPNWPEPGDSRLFLDSGPIARTVADAELMLRVMSGPDPRDPVSRWGARVRPPEPRSEPRVAWSPDWSRLAVDGEVREIATAAAGAVEEAGYRVEAAEPAVGDAMDILLPLIAADAHALLATLGADAAALSPEVRAELELLGAPTTTEYIRALNALWHYRDAIDRFFEDFDLMITPSTAVPAFPLGRAPSEIDGRSVERRWTTFMPFQAPWNLTGQPTATVPCGRTRDGLPIGLQVTAPRECDDRLLAACAAFEELRPWPSPGAPVERLVDL